MNRPRVLNTLRIVFRRYGWNFSAPCPACKLAGHPLSAVDDCLFRTLEASFLISRPSPPSATYMSTLLRTGEVHAVSWYVNFIEKEHLEDLHLDGRIILKLTLSMVGYLAGS